MHTSNICGAPTAPCSLGTLGPQGRQRVNELLQVTVKGAQMRGWPPRFLSSHRIWKVQALESKQILPVEGAAGAEAQRGEAAAAWRQARQGRSPAGVGSRR